MRHAIYFEDLPHGCSVNAVECLPKTGEAQSDPLLSFFTLLNKVSENKTWSEFFFLFGSLLVTL